MTETAFPGPATLRVGLITMCATRNVDENLAEATRLIEEAAAKGATYIQTPEFTTLMEMQSAKLFAATKPEENNPAVAHFQSLAKRLGIWLHLGSMGVLVKPDKIGNRSLLFTPDGRIAARYDKLHMFDAALGGGEKFRESKNFEPGSEAVVVDMPWGGLGLTVCYDLRFPGLFRALAQGGASIIAVPSAFQKSTGEVHWHPLLQARAIETGSYILASAQGGLHECQRETYGHALIVDPWGKVVAEAGIEPSVMIYDVELGKVAEARQRIPSLEHDRPFKLVHAAAT